MESDQLPVEGENLNPSQQGESLEAIATPVTAINPEITPEITPAIMAIADDADDKVAQLKQEESDLRAELEQLKTIKSKVLQEQIDDLQAGIIRLAQADVARLEYQKQELQTAIAILEKKKIVSIKK